MNFNEQLRKLYQEKRKVKSSDENYFTLVTESGQIEIPKKIVIKAFNSSIDHFKSRIAYKESNESVNEIENL